MASQYRAIGKDGYVSFQGTEVSADYRNFDVELTIDTIEKSAGSEASKGYIHNCVTISEFSLSN